MQLGGGLRTDDDLAAAFDWGVRWAVLGTRALQSPEWVRTTATRYPDQIGLGVDAKNGFVATDGWLEVSKVRAVELAKQVSDSPLAAVVYTDIAKDGDSTEGRDRPFGLAQDEPLARQQGGDLPRNRFSVVRVSTPLFSQTLPVARS